MTVFGVILFGFLIQELLEDWFRRGKDYVISCQENYVFKALIYMALIIAVGLYHLPGLIVLVALPVLAIGVGLLFSKYGLGLTPLLVLLLPFFLLTQAICNLFQPTSTKSR